MVLMMVAIMISLLVLGFPMLVPLIAAPIAVLAKYFPGMGMKVLIQQMISNVRLMSLIAIPMFIFAAGIMTKGETSDRLLDFVTDFVGHIRGGLAITTSATCTLFGAISGSTQATVVAIGGPMLPRLLKAGYNSSFAMGLIINSSDIALLIPPSIGMIVYGVVTGTSVGELFIAGIGPGILIFTLFSLFNYFYSKYYDIPVLPKATKAQKIKSTKKALLCFGFPILIVGGIYSGLFSPNEAAGVSILYAIILEIFIFKSLKFSDIPEIALDTGVITAVVFILIGVGASFSWMITFTRIPNKILPIILGTDPSTFKVLSIITLAYFVGCMFVDNIVVILVMTPVLYPVAMQAGIDPVLLGVIVTLQAAIGSATPPFGCDIFTAIAIFRRPYFEVIKSTPPFIIMLVLSSITIMLFPEVALFLRDIAFGY
ncbi:TRAP transporter large permease [Selenihalanaerobacter shriftii]|uniref:TRAP transporter, DctM subunit n=1 Tax=Selenihalanaerobacter shriftii TaxID=142842 RepID=A0A1T4R249_9FIRM|nr:TRAP transporter large permease [Selenihalanaerobacter shriftii]SKA09917.1 TRAP transporter, DctM subunit [Selenihalanaerobacter shriftii]